MRAFSQRLITSCVWFVMIFAAPASSLSAPYSDGPIYVGGPITQDTLWQGEIIVVDSVTVNPGVTLTVRPGTHVKFRHYRGYREPEKRLSITASSNLRSRG